MRQSRAIRRAVGGFTLLEIIIAVVLLGILGKVTMMKLMTPATLTLPSQAQSVADVIRRAQSLAMVRGERMRFTVTTAGLNGRIDVDCATTPCSNSATGLSASHGAIVGGSPSTIFFNSLGQPVNNAGAVLASDPSYTLSYTGASPGTYTVTVAALTGRVSVSP